jgi:hypothetical protein
VTPYGRGSAGSTSGSSGRGSAGSTSGSSGGDEAALLDWYDSFEPSRFPRLFLEDGTRVPLDPEMPPEDFPASKFPRLFLENGKRVPLDPEMPPEDFPASRFPRLFLENGKRAPVDAGTLPRFYSETGQRVELTSLGEEILRNLYARFTYARAWFKNTEDMNNPTTAEPATAGSSSAVVKAAGEKSRLPSLYREDGSRVNIIMLPLFILQQLLNYFTRAITRLYLEDGTPVPTEEPIDSDPNVLSTLYLENGEPLTVAEPELFRESGAPSTVQTLARPNVNVIPRLYSETGQRVELTSLGEEILRNLYARFTYARAWFKNTEDMNNPTTAQPATAGASTVANTTEANSLQLRRVPRDTFPPLFREDGTRVNTISLPVTILQRLFGYWTNAPNPAAPVEVPPDFPSNSFPRRFPAARTQAKSTEFHNDDLFLKVSKTFFDAVVGSTTIKLTPKFVLVSVKSVYGYTIDSASAETLTSILQRARKSDNTDELCREFISTLHSLTSAVSLDIPLVIQASFTSSDQQDAENTHMKRWMPAVIHDYVMHEYLEMGSAVDEMEDELRGSLAPPHDEPAFNTALAKFDEHAGYTIRGFANTPRKWLNDDHVSFTSTDVQVNGQTRTKKHPLDAYNHLQKLAGALLRYTGSDSRYIQESRVHVNEKLHEAEVVYKKFRSRTAGSELKKYGPYGIAFTLGVYGIYKHISDACPMEMNMVQQGENVLNAIKMIERTPKALKQQLKSTKKLRQCAVDLLDHKNSTEINDLLDPLAKAAADIEAMIPIAESFQTAINKVSTIHRTLKPVRSLNDVDTVRSKFAEANVVLQEFEPYKYSNYTYNQLQSDVRAIGADADARIVEFDAYKLQQFSSVNGTFADTSYDEMKTIVDEMEEHKKVLGTQCSAEFVPLFQNYFNLYEQKNQTDAQIVEKARAALSVPNTSRQFKTVSQIADLDRLQNVNNASIRDLVSLKRQAAQELSDDTDAQLRTHEWSACVRRTTKASLTKGEAKIAERLLDDVYQGFPQIVKECVQDKRDKLSNYVSARPVKQLTVSPGRLKIGEKQESALTRSSYSRVFELAATNDRLVDVTVENLKKLANQSTKMDIRDQAIAENIVDAAAEVMEQRGSQADVAACAVRWTDLQIKFKNYGIVDPTKWAQMQQLVDKCSAQYQDDVVAGLIEMSQAVQIIGEPGFQDQSPEQQASQIEELGHSIYAAFQTVHGDSYTVFGMIAVAAVALGLSIK